jgi:hypothetical protein
VTLRLYFRYAVDAHFLFEALSYLIGFRIYLQLRKRCGDVVTDEHRWGLIAAAITFLLNATCTALIFSLIYH